MAICSNTKNKHPFHDLLVYKFVVNRGRQTLVVKAYILHIM